MNIPPLIIKLSLRGPFASRESPYLCREVGGVWLQNLMEFLLTQTKPITGLIALVRLCVNNRGVQFHRNRNFKKYYLNSIQPTSHTWCTCGMHPTCEAGIRIWNPAAQSGKPSSNARHVAAKRQLDRQRRDESQHVDEDRPVNDNGVLTR